MREQPQRACAARQGQNPAWKLSVNDFVIKALALALQRVPDANVTWTEGGMLKHKHSDVGVAVAIEGGLFTPVIRKAETKTLSQISLEMKDLAGARPQAPAGAAGISGRHNRRLQSRHVRHQEFRRGHQSAACDDPRGRRRREARRRRRR